MDNQVQEGSFAENAYPTVCIHLEIRGPGGLETQKEAVASGYRSGEGGRCIMGSFSYKKWVAYT